MYLVSLSTYLYFTDKIVSVEFYIHGSVHRESNLITVQQDATVFSLLHFCRQLYMFRVLTSATRSSYNCNYSFWHCQPGLLPSALVVELEQREWPIGVAARSKAWVCGRSLAGFGCSNPTGGHGSVCFVSVVYCRVAVSVST